MGLSWVVQVCGGEGGVGLLGKKGEGQLISERLMFMIHPHQGGEGTPGGGGVRIWAEGVDSQR